MKQLSALLLLAALIPSTTATCPEPLPVVENATATFKNADETIARFQCNPGYIFIGPTYAICENGKWAWAYSSRPLVCRAVQCRQPPALPHAYAVGEGYDFHLELSLPGHKVTYTCDAGYKQVGDGSNTSVCQPDGQWSKTEFACGRATCPPLAEPQNGAVRNVIGQDGVYEYEYVYQYTCDDGYVAGDGKKAVDVTCRADGTWSEEVKCTEIPCGDPPAAAPNAYIAHPNNNGYVYGDAVEYTCYDYATMRRTLGRLPLIHCQRDGTWSSFLPYECVAKEPSCTAVPALANAQPKEKKEKYGNTEVVPYKCEEGYTGNPSVECTAGRWKPISGNCEPTTTPPTTTTTTPTTTTTTTPPTTTTTTPSATTAAAACPDPPSVDNALPAVAVGSSKNRAKYTCKAGYKASGARHIKCENGSWTPLGFDTRPLQCQLVSCGSAPNKDNAHMLNRGYFFGDTVYYKCDTGYKPVAFGLDHIVCQPNGQWTVINLTCVPVTCPPLSDPQNGKVAIVQGSTGKYEYGFRYRYDCDKGFTCGKGRTSVEVTCRADGTWTEEVQCRVPKCRDPPPAPLQDADVVFNENSYGDMAVYNCKHYTILHPIGTTPASYCQNDESWSAVTSPYECVAREPSCTAVPALANTQPKEKKEKYGDTEVVPYKCEEGYTGNPSVKCKAGRWESSGNCERVCTALANSNMDITATMQAGETKSITCDAGYTASGSTVSVRCVDGKLVNTSDNKEFKCTAVNCNAPPSVDNASYAATGANQFMYGGGGVTYVCNKGYKPSIAAVAKISCGANGLWSNLPNGFVCSIQTCPALTDPQNGKLIRLSGSGPNVYGDKYRYVCDDRYAFEGKKQVEVTCLDTGKWSIENVKCESVTCLEPPVPSNSQLTTTDGKFDIGANRVYTCNSGTTVEGTSGTSIVITCKADGTWTKAAKCTPTPTTTSTTPTTTSTSTTSSSTRAALTSQLLFGLMALSLMRLF